MLLWIPLLYELEESQDQVKNMEALERRVYHLQSGASHAPEQRAVCIPGADDMSYGSSVPNPVDSDDYRDTSPFL